MKTIHRYKRIKINCHMSPPYLYSLNKWMTSKNFGLTVIALTNWNRTLNQLITIRCLFIQNKGLLPVYILLLQFWQNSNFFIMKISYKYNIFNELDYINNETYHKEIIWKTEKLIASRTKMTLSFGLHDLRGQNVLHENHLKNKYLNQ